MNIHVIMPRLVDRKTLCKILGNVSLSHVIRLDQEGCLKDARIQVGPRIVRYDLNTVKKLIEARQLSMRAKAA